ncbi:MAG TPA: OsmC family protein [Solirubrobacteraceae bacterium]|nr:OsmC family protein [Solirubrobacteraceae bacterium]
MSVRWTGGKGDLRAHEIDLAGQTLSGSCAAAWGGDPEKADPEEMLVAALSACHMLWFLDFARRKRLRVVSYEDRPYGEMDARRFTEVVLRPCVAFETQVPRDVVERLHDQAHEACFIANSVTCEVKVEPTRLSTSGTRFA